MSNVGGGVESVKCRCPSVKCCSNFCCVNFKIDIKERRPVENYFVRKMTATLMDVSDNTAYNSITVFCKSSVCEKIRLVLATIVVFLLILVLFIGVSLQVCLKIVCLIRLN